MDVPKVWGPDGRYELTELLAQDAAGALWRARSSATGEPVAARLTRIGPDGDRHVIEELQAEWERLAAIHHPVLVRPRDLIVDGDLVGLFTDLVDGTSVRQHLDAAGSMAPAQAAGVAADLAEAIAVVHAAGTVHTGVTAQNVIIGVDGLVRLTDLATARLTHRPIRGASPRHAPAYEVPAYESPAYAAPELIQAQLRDAAADVYALGIVLYEMLTGTTPYEGGAIAEVLRRHVEAEPVWPLGLPSGLRYVLGRCLRHEPGERPTAAAVAGDLRALSTQLADLPRIVPPASNAVRYRMPHRAAAAPADHGHEPAHAAGRPPIAPSAHAAGRPPIAPPAPPPARADVRDRNGAHPHAHAAGRGDRPQARTIVRGVVAVVLVVALGTLAVITLRHSDSTPAASRTPNAGPSPTAAPPTSVASVGPSLSAAATQRTRDGGREFVSYWFEALNYAVRTGDVSGLDATSSPDCAQCQAAIDGIRRTYADGGTFEGGSYLVHSVVATEFPDNGQPSLDVVFDRSPRSTLDSHRGVRDTLPTLSFAVCRVLLDWAGGRWRVLTMSGTPIT